MSLDSYTLNRMCACVRAIPPLQQPYAWNMPGINERAE